MLWVVSGQGKRDVTVAEFALGPPAHSSEVLLQNSPQAGPGGGGWGQGVETPRRFGICLCRKEAALLSTDWG